MEINTNEIKEGGACPYEDCDGRLKKGRMKHVGLVVAAGDQEAGDTKEIKVLLACNKCKRIFFLV